MKRIALAILALCIPLRQMTEPTKRSQVGAVVTELRATKRLPAWANYVCYDDARNHRFEDFSLIAYQPYSKLSQTEKDAIKLGYTRSITFQWYMVLDPADIRPMNLPPSPEEFASTAASVHAGSTIDARQYTLLLEHRLSEQNAIALAKAARKETNASDEETWHCWMGRMVQRTKPSFVPIQTSLPRGCTPKSTSTWALLPSRESSWSTPRVLYCSMLRVWVASRRLSGRLSASRCFSRTPTPDCGTSAVPALTVKRWASRLLEFAIHCRRRRNRS
jgi:hypothetical protein